MDKINVNDVASVYSGKANTCYCGCAGKHTYNPIHVEWAGKNRGYAITPEEVDLKVVKRIVNKLNKNFYNLDDTDGKIFTLTVGKHDYTVYMRDYTEDKKAEEIAHKERHQKTVELVDQFNTAYPDGTVYLKLTAHDSASFQVHFRFNDKFVDTSSYDEGCAIIYPSDALRKAVDVIANDVWNGKKVDWNNTRSIGYFNY